VNFNGLFFLESRYIRTFPLALLIDFSFIHKTLVLEKIVNEGSAIVIRSQFVDDNIPCMSISWNLDGFE
jgi:hypothetical protein